MKKSILLVSIGATLFLPLASWATGSVSKCVALFPEKQDQSYGLFFDSNLLNKKISIANRSVYAEGAKFESEMGSNEIHAVATSYVLGQVLQVEMLTPIYEKTNYHLVKSSFTLLQTKNSPSSIQIINKGMERVQILRSFDTTEGKERIEQTYDRLGEVLQTHDGIAVTYRRQAELNFINRNLSMNVQTLGPRGLAVYVGDTILPAFPHGESVVLSLDKQVGKIIAFEIAKNKTTEDLPGLKIITLKADGQLVSTNYDLSRTAFDDLTLVQSSESRNLSQHEMDGYVGKQQIIPNSQKPILKTD